MGDLAHRAVGDDRQRHGLQDGRDRGRLRVRSGGQPELVLGALLHGAGRDLQVERPLPHSLRLSSAAAEGGGDAGGRDLGEVKVVEAILVHGLPAVVEECLFIHYDVHGWAKGHPSQVVRIFQAVKAEVVSYSR